MLPAELPRINSFKGLNNVTDALRLGLGWLTQADNVNITDSGAIERRDGYSLHTAGVYIGAYSTVDFARMYVVVGGLLKDFVGNTLKTLASSAAMHWAEVNEQVFFNNGTDAGIIQPDNTLLDWRWSAPNTPTLAAVTGRLPAGLYRVLCTSTLADGRETGACDPAEITLTDGQALQISGLTPGGNVYIAPADSTVFQYAGYPDGTAFVWNNSPDDLGRDFLLDGLDPLPAGADVIQVWKGRLYAAVYMPAQAQTAIFFSQPLGFHLFNLAQDFFMVPGKVLMLASMLAPDDTALIVGTDKAVHAYSPDGLLTLAPYGVIPGQNWSQDDKRILFWTARGLCAALPFTNLTERQISVAPGVSAGGVVMEKDGQKRYLVSIQQGGAAFNSHS